MKVTQSDIARIDNEIAGLLRFEPRGPLPEDETTYVFDCTDYLLWQEVNQLLAAYERGMKVACGHTDFNWSYTVDLEEFITELTRLML